MLITAATASAPTAAAASSMEAVVTAETVEAIMAAEAVKAAVTGETAEATAKSNANNAKLPGIISIVLILIPRNSLIYIKISKIQHL
ncbi:hypothetical protein EV146_104444 [Mesobacillus foraminis]|uniref:Uncharacterized protein n=1 Tax=Mesobacillus foraminis TaxID=279826 RepID=A0A4R2BH71_9BACI|nr:hypothetical protein EV146_104444 [Mesobacillus foraminis]